MTESKASNDGSTSPPQWNCKNRVKLPMNSVEEDFTAFVGKKTSLKTKEETKNCSEANEWEVTKALMTPLRLRKQD
ncbi:hypothetical protein YC2023_043780 [Brassica napus]